MTYSPPPTPRPFSGSARPGYVSFSVAELSPGTAQAADGWSPQPTSSADPNAANPTAPRRTIVGVEVARVGTFTASTGPATLTAQDFADALASFYAGIHPKPVLKIGHDDHRFDGQPSIGWVDNLRTDETGLVLIGDLCGVPQWIVDAMPTSYPNRSVEAVWDYLDAAGVCWPFVVTGLALLGNTAPAIGNLAELRDFVTMSRPATRTTERRQSPVTGARARRRRRNTL